MEECTGPSHKGHSNESEMEKSAGGRTGPSHKGCRNESEMAESAGGRTGPSHKGCKIQSYTFAFKLDVIQFAKDHNNSQASRKFNVARSRVIDWRRNEVSLRESGEGGKRMSGSGTKVTCLFIEERLKEWVDHMRDTGTRFNGSDLKKECLRLHQQVGNDYFKASCGWLRHFMKRNRIPSSRRVRNVSQSEQEGDSAMADNDVTITPSASGVSIGKMRKNVAKKSTTKPSLSLLKQTASVSDPSVVSPAAKLKVVMNGQQKTTPSDRDPALTNGSDHNADSTATDQQGDSRINQQADSRTDHQADSRTDVDSMSLDPGGLEVGTDGDVTTEKGNISIVADDDLKTAENIKANESCADNRTVDTTCEQNLKSVASPGGGGHSPAQNGMHAIKPVQKPKGSGLIITAEMNSYVRSLAKEAVSNVDVMLLSAPSGGGVTCSSTTESTAPNKTACNRGNLFDNLNSLSSERNGTGDRDGTQCASPDAVSCGDRTIVGEPTKATTTHAADNVIRDDKDILMEGVDDDTILSDVDDSILDDPSDQRLTVNGTDRIRCTDSSDSMKDTEGQPSKCDAATDGSVSDSVLATASSSDNVELGKKCDTSHDSTDVEDKPSSVTLPGSATASHRKRLMLDPTTLEPKKKIKLKRTPFIPTGDQTNNGVDSSSADGIVEVSSTATATTNNTTSGTVNELSAINITLEELGELIRTHLSDDDSLLTALQEKIASIQAHTEMWKNNMTDLQRQVAEITQLQKQHHLRRSPHKHRMQTRNWGVQVDEQKIRTVLNITTSPTRTSDTVKEDTSARSTVTNAAVDVQPTVSTSAIPSSQSSVSLVAALQTQSVAVRSSVSGTMARPTTFVTTAPPLVVTAASETVMTLVPVNSLISQPQTLPTMAVRPAGTVVPMRGTLVPTMPGATVPRRMVVPTGMVMPTVVPTGISVPRGMVVPTGMVVPLSPAGVGASTPLQQVNPAVRQILNHCVTSTYNLNLHNGSVMQSQPATNVTTIITARRIIDLTDDDDDTGTTSSATIVSAPVQTVGVLPAATLPSGKLIVRQPLASTPLQPGTFIIQSSGANPGTLFLQPTGVRASVPPRATNFVYPSQAAGGSGTYVLQTVTTAVGARPTVTMTQALPRLQSLSTGMLLMTRPPPPLQSAPGVRTRHERPPDKSHPAPLPPMPSQKCDATMKSLPPRPSLKISRVQQGIVLSWSMNIDDSHAKISKYQLFAYQEGTQPPNSMLWKKIGDVKALPLPMACTLTQFQEGNKYHFATRAVDIHERLGVFSDPSSIHLTKTL